ncbi:MAG: glutamine amidotransferase [bacterium]|nr:glutamine amidotransferase [bacterium]
MEKDFEINIAHLYPELMNIYGDFGNVCALKKRLEWRGIKVNICKISMGDDIDFDKYDIYFIGGGQDKQQFAVSEELQKNKDGFQKIAEDGAVMLAICGGYQLLGHYYQEQNGSKLAGIGLLDAYTIAGEKRSIGNVTIETDFLEPKTLVGFENHSGLTYLQGNTKPIGKVLVGHGNNLTSHEEGAQYNNIFGTYLHGSLLPKNPAFCDYLLQKAICRKLNDNGYILPEINDRLECLAHDNLINKSY